MAIAPGSGESWWDERYFHDGAYGVGEVASDGAWVAGTSSITFWESGETLEIEPGGRSFASDPADPDGLIWHLFARALVPVNQGPRIAVDGNIEAFALTIGAVAWRSCGASECAIRVLNLSRPPEEAEVVDLPAVSDGALAWDNDSLCASDPQLDLDEGAGFVVCTDGRRVEGLPGDHLGLAMGGGFAIGTFNKWIVPARTRIVPLNDGAVLAIEYGAEGQPNTIAGDDNVLVVGAPYEMHAGGNAGAVHLVKW